MAKAPKSEKNQKAPADSVTTNGWDVCIRFLDVVNDLFKTGNIFGAVLLLIFCYAAFVTYKLPADNINSYILMFSKFLGSERFYIAPGLLLLSLSLAANYLQHMYYTKEIRRLVAVRKQLVHGQEVGEIELLPNHSSSEFNIEATE